MKIYEAQMKYVVKSEMEKATLSSPEAVVSYMGQTFDERPDQESVYIIFLNRKNYPKGKWLAFVGSQNASVCDGPTVFRAALVAGANSIIVVHNHPSGDPPPSAADLKCTRDLCEAGKVVGISVRDHVIVGYSSIDPMGKGWFSFRQAGLMT